MSNRQQRRAQAKVSAKLPPLPQVPNISGTDQRCGNCAFAPKRDLMQEIISALGQHELRAGRPAPQMLPEDEVYCNAKPQECTKKVWGWCGHWQSRATATKGG